jgi:hypothetical protein
VPEPDAPEPALVNPAVPVDVRELARFARETFCAEYQTRRGWTYERLHQGESFVRFAAWCQRQADTNGVNPRKVVEGAVRGFFLVKPPRHWDARWLCDGPDRYADAYAESQNARASA